LFKEEGLTFSGYGCLFCCGMKGGGDIEGVALGRKGARPGDFGKASSES
jgi:hypothetical protein